VLQEMYKLDPSLSKDDAAAAINELKRAGRGSCRSRASTNEAVLAVLKKLNERRPGGVPGKAVVEVTRDALTSDLDDKGISVGGSDFGLTASIDSFSTLQAGAFDPGSILGSYFDLAQTNTRFGAARDLLWESASHMSLFDSTQSLLLGNPELAEVKPFIASHIDPDGSLVYSDAAPRAFIQEQFNAVNLASDEARDDTVQVETAKKDPAKTKEEIEAIKKQVKEDSDKRKEVLEDAEAGLKFAVFLVEKFDKQTAKDIEEVGKVAIKGAKLFNKLADTAGSITVNIATGNVFGVVKDLMGVAMELPPIFG